MQTPPEPPGSVTEFCGDGIQWCELCSATDRPLRVVIRPTIGHGDVCLTACPICAGQSWEYLRASAKQFAADHRRHLTRAADMADPRREGS